MFRTAHNAGETLRFVFTNPRQFKYVLRWTIDRVRRNSITVPWWTYSAVDWVADHLAPTATVFEWGSGASTRWLAARAGQVTSIEHDPEWYQRVRQSVPSNVSIDLIRPLANNQSSGIMDYEEYSQSISRSTRGYDLIIVDGRSRADCFRQAMAHVNPGGILLLDDSDRDRYQAALLDCSWPRMDFRGLKPGVGMIAQTSVWVRPNDKSPTGTLP